MSPYISVVIPVFNEESTIKDLWGRLFAVLESHFSAVDQGWEVVFTDDGSLDGSLHLLLEIARSEPRVTVVEFNRNYGQQGALFGGFSVVSGQVIVTLDADLQNPPEEIPKLVAKIEEGYDVVGGWRQGRMKADSLFRTLPSKLVNAITRKTTGVKLHDYGCMLRAYRREIVEAMLQCRERSSFTSALATVFAKRITEIPVSHAERAAGDSKYGIWKLISLQFDLLTGFSLLPLQLLAVFGSLLALLGTALGVYLASHHLLRPEEVMDRSLTLFAMLFFFVGAQFMAFGLLGEYIGRIYQEVCNRPRFLVKKVHKGQ